MRIRSPYLPAVHTGWRPRVEEEEFRVSVPVVALVSQDVNNIFSMDRAFQAELANPDRAADVQYDYKKCIICGVPVTQRKADFEQNWRKSLDY